MHVHVVFLDLRVMGLRIRPFNYAWKTLPVRMEVRGMLEANQHTEIILTLPELPFMLRCLLVHTGLLDGTADAHLLDAVARRVGHHPPHVRMPQR
jgi:hypothetical protein